MSDIKYTDMCIEGYQDNPLIEAIGWGVDEKEFNELCDSPFDGACDFTRIPESRHDFAKRSLVGRLKDMYVVKDEAHAIYENMLLLMHQGYVHRNPLSAGYKEMLTAIERDMADPLAAKHIKVAYGNSLLGAEVGNSSSMLAGLSGEGKTTLVTKALDQIKRTHHHTFYTDSQGCTHEMNFVQQTYLYVQLNTRKGQNALLKSILVALDEDTGENYSFIYRNATVEELITGVRKALIIHGVGLLVIDEAQNFSRPPKEITLGANEKTSIRFVEEIFNRIGVPLFLVGTHSMLDLFGGDTKTIRRVMSDGGRILCGSNFDSDFWDRFCRRMFRTEFLANQTTDYETFKRHLHNRTQGVTAIAKSLVIATLQYLTKFDEELQDLGIESLDLVFRSQFKLLIRPLKALQDGAYEEYEDYHILAVLEEIEQNDLDNNAQSDEAKEGKKAGKAEDKNVKGQSSSASTSKVFSNVPEIELEKAKRLGVNQIMGFVGD